VKCSTNLIMVLQRYGVTVELVGATFISKAVVPLRV
jgi:hypothetical protein